MSSFLVLITGLRFVLRIFRRPVNIVNTDNYCEKIFTNFSTLDHIIDVAHVLQFDR